MTKKKFLTAGTIVEFNPLHDGHVEHIAKTRHLTGCQYVVAVMSGNFVQRGEPALCDKFRRTKMALQAGVNMVIELPLPYVLSGADYFARGAVNLLHATGIVKCLTFGSESGNIEAL
jgi:predicted nucleotidyltransferase